MSCQLPFILVTSCHFLSTPGHFLLLATSGQLLITSSHFRSTFSHFRSTSCQHPVTFGQLPVTFVQQIAVTSGQFRSIFVTLCLFPVFARHFRLTLSHFWSTSLLILSPNCLKFEDDHPPYLPPQLLARSAKVCYVMM